MDGIFLDDNQHLSVVGLDLEEVPAQLGDKYGTRTKRLDLSYNALTKVTNLEKFTALDSLVLDCNSITGDSPLPQLSSLKTLSVNSNDIQDLETFLTNVMKAFPNLTYLSLLKNPCCPNFFTGKDQDDYQRYRYYVLFKMQNLKFLDSSPVTPNEKKEAMRVGKFSGMVARPDPSQYQKKFEEEQEEIKALPSDFRPIEVPTGASFGTNKYVYYGRQSEGNRFITNEEL